MKRSLFLSICLILSVFNIKAQIGLSVKKVVPPQYYYSKSYSNTINHIPNSPSFSLNKMDKQPLKPKVVPSAFSVNNLPFFCKMEYKMEVHNKVPIKFRLGDVQYVDELEGK